MTRTQLEELANRLESATRDVVTGERLDAGVYGHAPIEDLEEAAAFIRSLLAQEPVAWCHLEQWKSGQYWPDDCFGSQRLEGTVPLYAAPVPAVDPEWKAEAMRLAHKMATAARNDRDGFIDPERTAIAAHLDKAARAAPAQPTRSQKLAEAGYKRRPTTLEIQLKGEDAAPATFDRKRFIDNPPCYICGYNGPSYFNPFVHPCAAMYHRDAAPAQPCPFGCTTQEEHDAHYAPAQPACPDALLPDGPVCPRCGKRRGPSGIDGGSWVHYWPEEDDGIPKT